MSKWSFNFTAKFPNIAMVVSVSNFSSKRAATSSATALPLTPGISSDDAELDRLGDRLAPAMSTEPPVSHLR